ncbi:MAG TPA: hypothetical protein PLZ51_20785, partial [Aggregatilineales bacterium]|nr:hypothetical protein [Aggregatilineales bacterium]
EIRPVNTETWFALPARDSQSSARPKELIPTPTDICANVEQRGIYTNERIENEELFIIPSETYNNQLRDGEYEIRIGA